MKKLRPRLFFFIPVMLIYVISSRTIAQSMPDSLHNGNRDTATAKRAAVNDSAHRAPARIVDQDSLAFALKPHPYQPNPKKAGLYAAILPGLGQAYNHQYWKIPIVYVGLGIGGYVIAKNLNAYRGYRKSYIGSSDPLYSDDNFPKYSQSQLKQLQDDYYKYLDLSVLFTGLGYFLQVLDAITSAHLKNFDISRDISMHMKPVAMPNNGVGLGLVMNFKR